MSIMRFEVQSLNCGACAARAEKAMSAVPGVVSAHVNFADGTAVVEATAQAAAIAQASTDAGYAAREIERDDVVVPQNDEVGRLARDVLWAAVLTLPIFVVEMGGHLVPAFHHWLAQTLGTQTSWTVQFVLASLVLAGPGRVFYRLGVPALLKGAPDMNALVVLGATAAWAYSTIATFAPGWLPEGAVSVYFEAAAVIVTLILVGRLLEARAKGRTGAAIRRLIGLRPDTARVERDGALRDVPLEAVRVGDVVHLAAGARVPVDGVVRSGQGPVDEAMITGEPIAVEKAPGDALTAGTINGPSALTMEARAVGRDTMLARIISMVAEAQGARLPVQDLVNRITLWFVPAVMGVATVTVAAWLAWGALPLALVAGVSVLIIACPCAMGLATPTSIMVGTGRAADLGVLFRKGDALQSLAGVEVVAFDKTGTLTRGAPEVVACTLSKTDLAMVAAVEAASTHPLAAAIVAYAGPVEGEAEDVVTLPGLGVSGVVGGRKVVLGNAALMEQSGVPVPPDALPAHHAAQTPVFVAIEGAYAGALALADPVKDSAADAVRRLQSMGLRVAMISGDTEAAARAVAETLGIAEVTAGVRPDGKVAALRALQQNAKVAFVGDGINDAPALAAADVGVAMGNGTDIAVEAADVVLVSGNPLGVARALTMSRRTLRNIWQNLGWAFGYNVVLIPVAALGLLTPQLAALAMAASSVLVVSNALRLRWVKP